jgi:hypothetical protein
MSRIALAERSINVLVTVHRDTLVDMEARRLETLVRASVHYYNS